MNRHIRTPMMNFQQVYPHLFQQEISNLGNSSVMKKEEPRCAQMTIFYDGKVIVFDDIPAEKVKGIMVFCTKGTTPTSHSQNHNNNNYAFRFAQSNPSFLAINSANNSLQMPSTPVIYDLPMTRKASLHRFLEKRKDRIAARAPYQTSNQKNHNKPINEFMSWLSLAPQSPQDHRSECSSSSVFL
ncbi:protein TIFY 10a-like [Medicago truncatula]|uniref:protein TIFY 10a-like n=1 Tax=Medicago truncatula TaxID=3880 RepID=UPI000D2F24F1|nr:protein TIFY 10a-like [Medicago truncatula]